MTIPLRVLLIEDCADDASLLLHELERGGYAPTWERVDTATALSAALRQKWDLITCDYVMPQLSGLGALQLIHEHHCNTPVIVVSGLSGEEVIVAAMRAGAIDFVGKNTLARLLPAVTRALRSVGVPRDERLVLQSTALDAAANGIVITDRGGRIIWVNRAFTLLTGYSPAEVIGQNPRVLRSGNHDSGFYANLWTTILSGQVWSGEVVNRRKDGTQYTEEMTITPVRQNGEISHFIAIKQDVTERRRAEAELRQWNVELEQRVRARTAELENVNKELEAFSYSVSHDLRAPLRAIDGFAQALQEDAADVLDKNNQHYLERVRAAADRMGQLIDDILGLSRVTRSTVNRQAIDLSALAQQLVAELREAHADRQVEIRIVPNVVVHGDAQLLRVALENLLDNAWKYTSKHPRASIEFGCSAQDGETVYFVRDDGAGFDMAYAAKLFAPFQRLHGVSEFDGTGIGLATVQRVIHRHGGRIWAEGAVERGATFYFTLPPAVP